MYRHVKTTFTSDDPSQIAKSAVGGEAPMNQCISVIKWIAWGGVTWLQPPFHSLLDDFCVPEFPLLQS